MIIVLLLVVESLGRLGATSLAGREEGCFKLDLSMLLSQLRLSHYCLLKLRARRSRRKRQGRKREKNLARAVGRLEKGLLLFFPILWKSYFSAHCVGVLFIPRSRPNFPQVKSPRIAGRQILYIPETTLIGEFRGSKNCQMVGRAETLSRSCFSPFSTYLSHWEHIAGEVEKAETWLGK